MMDRKLKASNKATTKRWQARQREQLEEQVTGGGWKVAKAKESNQPMWWVGTEGRTQSTNSSSKHGSYPQV
jgi:hypothetical protein